MRLLDRLSTRFSLGAIASAAFAATLVACGGGGDGPDIVAAASSPTASKLSGTVAVGAPMLNATVTVKDAKGATVSAAVAADGSYSGLSLDGLNAPFSLQACGLVDGNYACFYAVVQEGGIGNVTPLTHASVALALGGDPGGIFAASGAIAPPIASDLDAQVRKLKAALGDLLAKAGIGSFDFATSPFNADRTGMDKVLDAVKVSTGIDGDTHKTFVQVEGKIGSGNAYLDKDAASGTLAAGTGLDVDLRGISRIFVDGLSHAISASSEDLCVTRMTAADIFDDAFRLDMDKTVHVAKANAPTMICHFAALEGLLGGVFANPVLKDCDFTTDPANKVCVAGFNIVNGDVRFEGAELAVVLRSGAAWKLLGRDSVYDIHVGAAAQRTVRVDLPAGDAQAAPQYTRALQFDITGRDASSDTGVRAAKVYQRNLDGSGWEATPLVRLVLTDACIAQLQAGETARLGVVGSSCGSSWLSLGDSTDGAGAAAIGDLLIDNFYKRGRKVRVDLYDNVAATGAPVSIVKRVDGVPPKFAALATFPWLELDATTRATLVSYDGVAHTYGAGWIANPTVSANDITFCLGGNCQGPNRAAHADIVLGHTSQSLTLDAKPASAAAYKQISLYGRDHDQVGVSTNYVSCGGLASCF
ncbi:MAG: hypothetical protein ABIV63_06885 [Caldimonas sp.]